MHDKFQGCAVVVSTVTLIVNNPRANPAFLNTLNVCHVALHDVSVIDGWFQTGRVHFIRSW